MVFIPCQLLGLNIFTVVSYQVLSKSKILALATSVGNVKHSANEIGARYADVLLLYNKVHAPTSKLIFKQIEFMVESDNKIKCLKQN